MPSLTPFLNAMGNATLIAALCLAALAITYFAYRPA